MPIVSNPIAEISSFDKERFWSKVNIGNPQECWNWKCGLFASGYGQFRLLGKPVKAHRISYAIANGNLPTTMFVIHKCDNPKCVNPSHLSQGTHLDNMRDMKEKSRAARGDWNGSRLYPQRLARGETQHLAKLKTQDVIDARRIYATGAVSYGKLAIIYGVKRFTITQAIKGRTWAHIA
jgi:hypothetical protein